MTVHRLPVAGIDVSVQLPTGAEDLLLVESGPPSVGVALALLSRVVHRLDGRSIEWTELAPTDIDVLLLVLRRRVVGDVVTADVSCRACKARVEISFSIADLLDHNRSRPPAELASGDDGWFRLDDAVEFRLPRAGDQLAIALEPDPVDALIRLCIRPASISEVARAHVEAAMEALAPSMVAELEGCCPDCGETVSAAFDPLQYTLRELRNQAAYVYEDVLAIARHTHWSERDILALPAARRARYAELARDGATAS